jgi:hypothetical protein
MNFRKLVSVPIPQMLTKYGIAIANLFEKSHIREFKHFQSRNVSYRMFREDNEPLCGRKEVITSPALDKLL